MESWPPYISFHSEYSAGLCGKEGTKENPGGGRSFFLALPHLVHRGCLCTVGVSGVESDGDTWGLSLS